MVKFTKPVTNAPDNYKYEYYKEIDEICSLSSNDNIYATLGTVYTYYTGSTGNLHLDATIKSQITVKPLPKNLQLIIFTFTFNNSNNTDKLTELLKQLYICLNNTKQLYNLKQLTISQCYTEYTMLIKKPYFDEIFNILYNNGIFKEEIELAFSGSDILKWNKFVKSINKENKKN